MERIKRFLREEKASSEAVSSVILIAAAAILLSAALMIYYGAFSGFFTKMETFINGAPTPTWSTGS
jgi:hypothetical protein